ncbi:hypothetical protein GNX18_08665 [Microbulbifer sp. SH-1]|uniref:DUF6279 family lipoprotein n=1 Tax=Microbulbifer sp. SH-1 TaxID=2681547 RepID=UPI001407DB60|nr:DUF6279 family lipoprotein [Microbulbifer sp. SH-1]QIL89810.1 hypothetical protein GNX18_08665 [Microbulbifer sp. SH-1]
MTTAKFHPWVTRATALLLVLTLLLAGGCSSVRLVYGHLDWWMDRTLNKYLDLKGPQKNLLSQRVDEFHRWHRQTQLPRYADYLEQLSAEVYSPDVSPARLIEIENQAEAFWNSSISMLSDLLLPVLLQLDATQINTLAENAREEREKSLKKWQKERNKREKEFRKQAERWLGDLTPQQDAMVERELASTTFDPKLRDAQRERWTNAFIRTLKDKPTGYEKTLRDLLTNPQSLWSEEYRQMQEQLRVQARNLGSEILQSSTAEQRQHLKSTLEEYATDFRLLAAQKP